MRRRRGPPGCFLASPTKLNTAPPSLAAPPPRTADALTAAPRVRRVDLLAIALTAVAVRVLIVAISARMPPAPWAAAVPHPTESPFWHHALWGDGYSYLAQAQVMREAERELTEFDRRAFPGFPAMMALANVVGIDFSRSALLIPWLCAGIAAAAAAALFADRRIGWAMAFLTPHYLCYSAMPMTEGIVLALVLGGACVARYRPKWAAVLGGLLIGYAGMVRPMACFGAAGYVAYEWYRGRIRRAGVAAIGAAGVVAAGIVLLHWWTGDAFEGVRVYATHPAAYNGHLLTWPFHSLLTTPGLPDLPRLKVLKVVYVWGQAALVLGACGILVRRVIRARRQADPLDVLCLPWLIGNTLFVLCVGDRWGFLAFPRFILAALPPVFWAYRRWLPTRWWAWALVAVPSIAIAVDSVWRMN